MTRHVRRDREPEELIDCWTLVEGDWDLVANKAGATRLGFALLLKFFELEGRFPRHAGEVPKAVVDYVVHQVGVPAVEFAGYDWSGRSVKYHRAQIRKTLAFREASVGDEDKLATWLAEEVCPVELAEDLLHEALLARCRAERVEPPGPSRIERVLGTARAAAEQRLTALVLSRLPRLPPPAWRPSSPMTRRRSWPSSGPTRASWDWTLSSPRSTSSPGSEP